MTEPESTLFYDQFRLDPGLRSGDGAEPSPVWAESQRLHDLVVNAPRRPSGDDRKFLAQAVRDQVRTLDLYTVAAGLHEELPNTRNARAITLYVLLFPGQARDNTGIKDLNDKVLGYTYNSEFMKRRQARIASIFTTVGQDYKTAYLLADPKDFSPKVKTLDAGLRDDLIAVLEIALKDDSEEMKKKRPEIQKLLKTLKRNARYRFDLLFGSDTLTGGDEPVHLTFRLITEALKAAGIARYAVKRKTMKRPVGPNAPAIRKGEDDRGQPFSLAPFLQLAKVPQDIKKNAGSGPVVYLHAYVNTVWTSTFLLIERLFYANPVVMRDVRKKALVNPPKSDGIKIALDIQIQVLEMWIVTVNLIDFASGFLTEEFPKKVDQLHVRARDAVTGLAKEDQDVRWADLVPLLTKDVRADRPVAQQGTPSQFQFYSAVAGFPDQIFITMDIRDLGVELMNYYEIVTELIVFRQLGDDKLLEQTLRSNDGTLQRKRRTYEQILAVFRRHYLALRGGAGRTADIAFGRPVSRERPGFENSVQVMIGGDEFFIGAHPLYADRITPIIAELDTLGFNMRAGVAFSSAAPGENAKAHDRAMKLSGDAPNMLKQIERQNDRIERLIGVLESHPKNKNNDQAPDFRRRLAGIGLLRLYARTKFGHAAAFSPTAYARLRQALIDEDLPAALRTGEFELVDFDGNKVDATALLQRATDLEAKVRSAVGFDNIHVDPPPTLFLSKEAETAIKTVEKIINTLRA